MAVDQRCGLCAFWLRNAQQQKGAAVMGTCREHSPAGVIVTVMAAPSIANPNAPTVHHAPGSVFPPMAEVDPGCARFIPVQRDGENVPVVRIFPPIHALEAFRVGSNKL